MDAVVHLRVTGTVLAALLIGCNGGGPATYRVAGKVTYQGDALPTGNVMFVPDSGPAAATAIGPDGSYTLQAVAGRHRVVVTAVLVAPPDADEMTYQAPPPLVPQRFGRAETSGVTVTVEPNNKNAIDIALD